MNRTLTNDMLLLAAILALCVVIVAFGGLSYPNTLAGSFARFVFSLR